MRLTKIHLSEPFKDVLATLLALPSTHAEADELHVPDTANSLLRKSAEYDAEVKEALRSLYEAAHGRQVETPIGFVAIAPPVAGFLKETPYCVATQHEFFLEAFTRILIGDSPSKGRTNGSRTRGNKCISNPRENGHPRSDARRENGNTSFPHASSRFSNHEQIMHL